MNIALEGESPYDNSNLFGYLMKHMSVMKSTSDIRAVFQIRGPNGGSWYNAAFYTTDGMRYEVRRGNTEYGQFPLYENPSVHVCTADAISTSSAVSCGGCGALGTSNNSDGTTKPPCLIMVDVNGDRKPNPQNASCKSTTCAAENIYKFADPQGLRLTDMFTIMITDKQAIPYGVAAQRAMYSAQKGK